MGALAKPGEIGNGRESRVGNTTSTVRNDNTYVVRRLMRDEPGRGSPFSRTRLIPEKNQTLPKTKKGRETLAREFLALQIGQT